MDMQKHVAVGKHIATLSKMAKEEKGKKAGSVCQLAKEITFARESAALSPSAGILVKLSKATLFISKSPFHQNPQASRLNSTLQNPLVSCWWSLVCLSHLQGVHVADVVVKRGNMRPTEAQAEAQ